MSLMPISSGLPRWTGAPCTEGKRVVTCTARIASAGLNGRIETTIGPWNGPAGLHSMLVRYIGTLTLQVWWRISRPFSISASSNENEQPSTNDTRSSRHTFLRSRHLLDQLAVLPDAVERDVGADVEILAQRRQAPVARLGLAEQRAGLGVELAEAREVGGEFLGQDGEIALHVARRHARGRREVGAGADAAARVAAGFALEGGDRRVHDALLLRYTCWPPLIWISAPLT